MPELWCPFATHEPTNNKGYTVNGEPVPLTARAIVGHSADSPLDARPPRRFFDDESASSHFWIMGDGEIIQLVPLNTPAWANGRLNRPDGRSSDHELIRSWYQTGRNPNFDTISCEFAGFGKSRGSSYTPLTPEQEGAWGRLARWLEREGHITLSLHTILLHQHISRTACPDGRFTRAELLQLATDSVRADSDARIDELQRQLDALEDQHQRLNDAVLARLDTLTDAANALAEGAIMAQTYVDKAADPATIPGEKE